METGVDERDGARETPKKRKWIGRIIKGFICLLILAAGAAGASYMTQNAQRPRRQAPVKMLPLVRVEKVPRTTERVVVSAMGTVIPASQVMLKSRVSGQIVSVASEFTTGGLIKKGMTIIELDPLDYRLVVMQRKSQVINAEFALKVEQGHQDVARREWELLNDGKTVAQTDIELALRKPHLEKARADLAAAQAQLEQAELNLARTRITAPFNAVIRAKYVNPGSQVSLQDQLAELAGTDEYWVQVSLPKDRLKWIDIPRRSGEAGSTVRILSSNGSESGDERTGVVIKLLSDLETKGRMARILVAVKDPLDLKSHRPSGTQLLISDMVRVEIQGGALENVTRISRSALRNNKDVWIFDQEGALEIRPADIVWRDDQTVLLRNTLGVEDQLIISDLSGPVEGMALRAGPSQGDSPDAPPAPGPPAGKGGFVAKFDGDRDGKVSKKEFKGPAMVFKMFDKDGDGFVSRDEAPKGSPPGGQTPRG